MKKTFLVLSLLYAVCLNAQTTTLSLSKKFSLKDPGSTLFGAVMGAGDFYYSMVVDYKGMQFAYSATLNKIKYSIEIHKYDEDMKEVKKISLPGHGKDLGPFPPAVRLFHGKICVFYYKVLEDNTTKLSFSTIDPNTLTEMDSKDLYTFSDKNVGLFRMGDVIGNNSLLLELSPDKTQLLVAQSGNTKEVFTCCVDSNLAVQKPKVSKIKNIDGFQLEAGCLDNAGNLYFSFLSKSQDLKRRGLWLRNNKDEESFVNIKTGPGSLLVNKLSLKMARDKSQVYVFADYGQDNLAEGVLLTTVDKLQHETGNAQLIPYPEEIKAKLKEAGFTQKFSNGFSVYPASYKYTELEDGTVVLTGFPEYNVSNQVGNNGSVTMTTYRAGPVINVFTKEGKSRFDLIFRNQPRDEASSFIALPYQDKFVCIYTDFRKNAYPEGAGKIDRPRELVLTQATWGADGTLLGKKEVAARPDGGLTYFINNATPMSDHSWWMPLGRNRVNMVRYYTEIEQWATLEVK